MIKKIFNFVLNFFMSVFLLFLIFLILIQNTIFNENYIKEKFNENKFYERTYSDIKEEFENYTIQSGLDLEILNGLFSKEKVINDINLKLDEIYFGKKINIDTDSIRNELDSRINKALEDNNRVPSNEEKKSINKYEDTIIECYKSGILYGTDLSIDYKYLDYAIEICIVGLVIVAIILLIINKNIFKSISFLGINLLFSGILYILLRGILKKRISHILILDSKFSNFIVNILTDILEKINIIGIIAIVLGLFFIIIGNLKKSIEIKKD